MIDTLCRIWVGSPYGHPATSRRDRTGPIQTVPGKGWNTILRLYGPRQEWFDKTWRPGDPQLVR